MINAKELRIGNIIQVGGNTMETYQTYKPCKVTVDIIKAIEEENEERPDAILSVWQPIKLTSEILQQCGFDVRDDNPKQKPQYEGDVLFDILDFEFSNSNKSNSVGGFYSYQINNGNTIIKYLHQLQNLFYDLTGEELPVKFEKEKV